MRISDVVAEVTIEEREKASQAPYKNLKVGRIGIRLEYVEPAFSPPAKFGQ